MISSGIRPLDEDIGGVLAGRTHLVTGGPGTGKTALGLQFAWSALRRREGAVILTDALPGDLKSLARHLGMDLDAEQRAGRLLLLRYRDEFPTRFAFAANPGAAADHLRRFAESVHPERIVVDSFAPFLADGAALGAGVAALVEFLHGSGATALATYPLDLEHGYDPRLAPIVQEAAAIFRLTRAGAVHRLQVVTTRYAALAASTTFAIRRGEGVVPATHREVATPQALAVPDDSALLLAGSAPPPIAS